MKFYKLEILDENGYYVPSEYLIKRIGNDVEVNRVILYGKITEALGIETSKLVEGKRMDSIKFSMYQAKSIEDTNKELHGKKEVMLIDIVDSKVKNIKFFNLSKVAKLEFKEFAQKETRLIPNPDDLFTFKEIKDKLERINPETKNGILKYVLKNKNEQGGN